MYRIELTPKAEEELRALGRSGDKASINKVYRLFEELRVHPYEGTGKPEPLVGDNTMFQAVSEENFQMLGYPAFEQYDEVGSQFDTLLLQIPTIDATDDTIDDYQYDTIWGDCGSMRLFINSGNLRRLDFSSEVMCVFQCY